MTPQGNKESKVHSVQVKALPQDFHVQEVLKEGFLTDHGEFMVYLLRKSNMGTQEAVDAIARKSGVPPWEVRFAGRKDRRGVTSQFITSHKRFTLRSPDHRGISLSPVGLSTSRVAPSHIEKNLFRVTLRAIKDAEYMATWASRATEGFPNYFDDQRFGSVGISGEYAAEKIVKGHLNGALKLLLTDISPEDPPECRSRKEAMAKIWGDFKGCLNLAKLPLEAKILSILSKCRSTRGMKEALRAVPRDHMSLLFSAYQSFLWNLTVSRIFMESGEGEIIPIRGGNVFFPSSKPAGHPMEVYTASYKVPPMGEVPHRAMQSILSERDIRTSMFNIRFIRWVHFGSFPRLTWQEPGDFSMSDPIEDEITPGMLKVTLSFSLPRGSYATMMIKYLTSRPA